MMFLNDIVHSPIFLHLGQSDCFVMFFLSYYILKIFTAFFQFKLITSRHTICDPW